MTRAPVQVRVIAVLALFGAAARCGADPVKIATLEDAGVPLPCTGWNDGGSTCDGSFCEWTSCGGDLLVSSHPGYCEPFAKESECPTSESAVCGCDGVHYFNDCFRQVDGVSLLKLPCNLPCGPGLPPCPEGRTCVALFQNALLASVQEGLCQTGVGQCWRLPAVCGSSDAGTSVRNLCDQDAQCVDECTALQNGTPLQSGGVYQTCTSP
jgi:hypothetical protein